MGVGDRHSKRAAALGRTRISPPAIANASASASAAERSYPPDERELDDAFSAWDDDDAGAHRPAHPSPPAQLAQATTSSLAQTRIERKPLAAGTAPARKVIDALVDPVAMRDIVISRARTLDDPLTTRVLAEIARAEAMNESSPHPADELATPRRRTTRREIPRDELIRKK